MAEVAHATEHHGYTTLVGGVNDFVVAHGATGLDNAGGACIDHHIEAVAEGEERVARHHRTLQGQACVACLDAGDAGRVQAAHLASIKAGHANLSLQGTVVASDAFFPFRDGLDVVVDAGATCVIQPGGSMRDNEVIDAANERGVAMVFSGVRHFRH